MKTSCIPHPASEPLIIIRQWQMEACEGNACAAALLSYFEYWHNIRLSQSTKSRQQNEVAKAHGEIDVQDESLLQFHTEDELERGIIIYKRDTIRAALTLLESLKFIKIRQNPNRRFKFDKTRYFLFQTDKVSRCLKNLLSSRKNRSPSPNSPSRSPINPSAITETTSETTTESRELNHIAASPRAVKSKPEKPQDPRAHHPAIEAVRKLQSRYPDKIFWNEFIELLGDNPDEPRLLACRKAWRGRGNNPNSIDWVYWYRDGIPEGNNGNGRSRQTDAGDNGSTPKRRIEYNPKIRV